MLVCPEEEYHDLGIRMGADFFTIAGYDVTYIGSNTPKSNILSAARFLKPDIIDISVSNYLNLVMLEKIIPEFETGDRERRQDFGQRQRIQAYRTHI